MFDKDQYIYMLKVARLEQLTEGPTAEEQAIVSQHFSYLQDLTEQGIAILVGRTLNLDANTFGIVVFQAATEAEAEKIMIHDPAVKNGVMQARLFPFRIALMQGV